VRETLASIRRVELCTRRQLNRLLIHSRFLPNAIRLRVSAVALLVATGCGGGSRSVAAPTPTPTPTPSVPAVPVNTWSIAGTVVETVGGQPVAGASVTPSWDLAAASASPAGDYSLGAVARPPTSPYKVSVAAAGFITHERWVTWQAGSRSNVTLDLIRNAAPFSMDFYGQLVRGRYDQEGAPWNVQRWTQAPRFYFKTVDQTNRPLEPEVVVVIRDALARAVPVYTGGVYNASIETGTETRAAEPGWINVLVRYDLSERRTCGMAFVGRDPGEITLIINDVCSCGSIKVPGSVVMHEVGHALGFFHVADNRSVMYPFAPGNCPPGEPTAAERFHAAIAYQRPRGNAEPDIDPSSGSSLSNATTAGPPDRVKN
jgi:hypothetical protein